MKRAEIHEIAGKAMGDATFGPDSHRYGPMGPNMGQQAAAVADAVLDAVSTAPRRSPARDWVLFLSWSLLVFALGLMLGGLHASLAEPEPVLPYCATEDSAGCIWDADVQGNGAGRSFITTTDNQVIYLMERN